MSPSEALREYTLGVTEAADLLGVQPMTIRRWIQDGKLPAKRPGKLYKLRQADIDALLEGADVVPAPAANEPPKDTMGGFDQASMLLGADNS